MSLPPLIPQLASLSRDAPNLTCWVLLLSEKLRFSPVSKASVKVARSCLLSSLEFLNLAKGEKMRGETDTGKDLRVTLRVLSGPSSHDFGTLVET